MNSDNQTHQTNEKIYGFANLQTGWHYGEGIPPTQDIINKALILNEEAANVGFRQTNAFPGIDGEIRVTAYYRSIYLEMTIGTNGFVRYIYEYDDNERENVELTFTEARAKIRDFRGHLWGSFGLFTLITTTTTGTAFKVSPSKTPVADVVFPSSTGNVVYGQAPVSANISKGFTALSQEVLPFSGKYRSNYFLKAVTSSQNRATPEMIVIST